jgi:hypothetical protein
MNRSYRNSRLALSIGRDEDRLRALLHALRADRSGSTLRDLRTRVGFVSSVVIALGRWVGWWNDSPCKRLLPLVACRGGFVVPPVRAPQTCAWTPRNILYTPCAACVRRMFACKRYSGSCNSRSHRGSLPASHGNCSSSLCSSQAWVEALKVRSAESFS